MTICGNKACIYRKESGACVKDFTMLNSAGMCLEFWNKNGESKMANEVPTEANRKNG